LKWPNSPRYNFDELEDRIVSTVLKNTPNEHVGILLSGGLDSSMIYHCLRDKRFPCYVSGSPGDIAKARMWEQFGANVTVVHEENLFKLVDILSEQFTECPIQFNSVLPLFSLCERVSQDGIKYFISGEGGDEIFWGYPRYLNFIDRIKRQNLFSFSELVYYGSGLNNKPMVELLTPDRRKGDCWEWLQTNKRTEPHQLVCLFDQVWRLPQLMLRNKRVGDIFGIDFIYPFMDNELVNYVNELDLSLKFRDGIQRYAQKVIARKWLPPQIFNQPKQPFDSIFSDWFTSKECRAIVHKMPWETLDINQHAVDIICQSHVIGRQYDVLMQKLFYYGVWRRSF